MLDEAEELVDEVVFDKIDDSFEKTIELKKHILIEIITQELLLQ